MKIYLAGGTSPWRDAVIERWRDRDVELINPFVTSQQTHIAAFTEDDLWHVDTSDLVFGVHDYHAYAGTALEFGYAHALKIPIIYVCRQPRIDSMMVAIAKAAFTDLEAALVYVEERILI